MLFSSRELWIEEENPCRLLTCEPSCVMIFFPRNASARNYSLQLLTQKEERKKSLLLGTLHGADLDIVSSRLQTPWK